MTGYDMGWPDAPAGSDVRNAREALTNGLSALHGSVRSLNEMISVGLRGDGGTSRIRNRPHTNDTPRTNDTPHTNDAPGRHGNGKPTATRGRPIPAQSPEHGSGTAVADPAADETASLAPAETGGGSGGVPDRPDPGDAAAEVWALVERAQAGDSQAFGLIYDRYIETVFRFIYFRVGNRQLAEDLTSDTFLRALKRIGSFTWQGRDLGAWLVTIARNLVADHFKSGRYRLEVTTGDVLDAEREDRGPEGSPEAAVVDHITNVALLTAVKQLNPEQQECIVLRFLQGFSVAETAQAMNKNEGAIKALQYRAVRALARLLPDGFQP